VTGDRLQQVLEERARLLARPAVDHAGEDVVELVVLTVGAERYGIDVRLVREVRPLAGLAPVPGTPGVWAGLVNLRGSLCPVLSLRHYLQVAAPGGEAVAAGPGVLAVVTVPFPAALLVDAAAEVRRCRPDELRPVQAAAGDRAHMAVTAVSADLLQVLDPAAVLADPALMVGHEAG
jgi:purine-binding chemotaxis protein CheW